MNVIDQARVIIYRINKKGLEIFLINTGGEVWNLPAGQYRIAAQDEKVIVLDPILNGEGKFISGLAVEGDWHDIPSIREIIKDDVRIVKDHLKQIIPEMEQGAFFAVKEAFKKVLPEQYAFLKELKEILLDRNQVKYI